MTIFLRKVVTVSVGHTFTTVFKGIGRIGLGEGDVVIQLSILINQNTPRAIDEP